jgi:hypothetical protein
MIQVTAQAAFAPAAAAVLDCAVVRSVANDL